MNNQMHVFKITVPGKVLDDKLYYQYTDFEDVVGDATKPPSDAQTVEKSKAYVRMRYFNIQLASLMIPVYATFEPTTAGTCAVIPDTPVLHIGYVSYEPFLSTLSDAARAALDTEDKRTAAAASVIEQLLIDALAKDLVGEQIQVQKTTNRTTSPLTTTEVDYREISIVELDVPGSEVLVTVEYVKL